MLSMFKSILSIISMIKSILQYIAAKTMLRIYHLFLSRDNIPFFICMGGYMFLDGVRMWSMKNFRCHWFMLLADYDIKLKSEQYSWIVVWYRHFHIILFYDRFIASKHFGCIFEVDMFSFKRRLLVEFNNSSLNHCLDSATRGKLM